MDTTLVSPLHGDGTARRYATTTNGVALEAARRARVTTHGCSRWSQETADFLNAIEDSGTRIPTDLAGQGQNRASQTLERNFGVQLGQVASVVLVGATVSSWDRRRHPFCP